MMMTKINKYHSGEEYMERCVCVHHHSASRKGVHGIVYGRHAQFGIGEEKKATSGPSRVEINVT